MAIYYLFMGSLPILFYLYKAHKSVSMRKLYCIIVGVVVFLFFAFRDVSLGMYDVQQSYTKLFHVLSENQIAYIFKNYTSDYLFYLFTKLVTIFTSNINVYLAISSAPIVCAIGILIYRYSEYPWLSWIMFFSLGYFAVNVTILRQSIAIAVCVFMFLSAMSGKYKIAYFLWIIAIGFHLTAVVAIFPVLIIRLRIRLSIKKGIIVLVTSLIVLIFSGVIVDFLFSKLSFERFQRYALHLSSFNLTLFAINVIQCLFCLIIFKIYCSKENYMHYKVQKNGGDKHDKRYNRNDSDQWMVLIIMFSLPFYALTKSFADIYRLGLYFSTFSIVAMPNYLSRVPKLLRYLVFIVMISIYFYYAYSSGLVTVSPYISVI